MPRLTKHPKPAASVPIQPESRIPPQSTRTATAPDVTLDPDPGPDPMGEVFAEWEDEHVERARHSFYTPPDVLKREREQAEEIDHARAKARAEEQARIEVQRGQAATSKLRKMRSSGDALRRAESREMISRAAKDAGGSVKLFCEFLDRDGVPTSLNPTLHKKGVKTWLEAYDKRELRSVIRSAKWRSLL